MVRIRASTVDGRVAAPPSKSYTHRAYVLAALSGDGVVQGPLHAEDTDATLDGLRALGFDASRVPDGVRLTGHQAQGNADVDARNSGTTLRTLTAVAALGEGSVRLTGDDSLRRRPLQPLLDALEPLGVTTQSNLGRCPVTVRGPLRGGSTRLDPEDSSQYLTALLLAAPHAPQDTRLALVRPPRSHPYVDVTRRTLEAYGLRVESTEGAYRIPGGQRAKERAYRVPGDWSNAAFFLAAAAATGGRVTVTGIDKDDVQGDRAIVPILEAFGCKAAVRDGIVELEGRPLEAGRVDLSATPDLFPVLCAVAAVADGNSRLAGAPQLRFKESDRIEAMRENLQAFGIEARPLPDGLDIRGGTPKGATIKTHGDHRIAQAGILLAMAAQGESRLDDPHVLDVSYPGLLEALGDLGGTVTA